MNSRIAIIPNATIDAFKPSNSTEIDQTTALENGNASLVSFLTLPHPRTGYPALFVPFKTGGGDNAPTVEILEVNAVDPPASRSWFMDNDTILEDGRLLLMTPVDPAFLLIPVLRTVTPVDGTANFRTLEDIFNQAVTKLVNQSHDAATSAPSISEADILQLSTLDCIPSAMSRLCETKELDANTTVYRFSLPKTVDMLRDKVSRLATPELAARIRSITRSLALDGLGQTEDIQESLREAGRLKLSCDVLSQYLPSDIYNALLTNYDFDALNKYVRSIRAEAAPSATVNKSNATSKASGANNKGAEGSKKRKAETQASRGTQKLLKTDTSKMAKLTTFFTKKPA